MRSTRLLVAVFALSSALVLVACGDGDGTASPSDTAETTPAEGSDGDDGDALFDGMTVAEFYEGNCAACHGGSREGISGLGLSLLPDRLDQDDDFYRDVIANGRVGTIMPAWRSRGVSDAEVEALIAFIRSTP